MFQLHSLAESFPANSDDKSLTFISREHPLPETMPTPLTKHGLTALLRRHAISGIVKNLPLSMHGELQFMGRSIWRRHKDYKKGDLVDIVITRGRVKAIYNSKGEKIFPGASHRLFQLYDISDFSEGKISPEAQAHNTFFNSKYGLTKYIQKHCFSGVVGRFPLGKRGAMHFLGTVFWDTRLGCREGDYVTVIVKKGEVSAIYSEKGEQLYPPQANLYEVYVDGCKIEQRFKNKIALSRFIKKSCRNCVVRNVPLQSDTFMQFLGTVLWWYLPNYKRGDLFTMVIKDAAVVSVSDAQGTVVMPRTTGLACKIYTGGVFADGHWVRPGKEEPHYCLSKSSMSQYVLKHYPDCVIEDFPLGNHGKLQFLGSYLWDSKRGSRKNDLVTLIIRGRSIREVYNGDRKKIFPEPDNGYYKMFTGGVYENGVWVEPGTLVSKTFNSPFQLTAYIKKNIDHCVIERFKIPDNGNLQLLGQVVWQKQHKVLGTRLVTVVVADKKVCQVYSAEGTQLYPAPLGKEMRITLGGVFRDGAWVVAGKPVQLAHVNKRYISRYIKKYTLSCIIEQFPLCKNGKLQFLNTVPWNSHRDFVEGDVVTLIIKNAQLKAVYHGKNGTCLWNDC